MAGGKHSGYLADPLITISFIRGYIPDNEESVYFGVGDFEEENIEHTLSATKDLKLEMKLHNELIPLTSFMAGACMGLVLWAADEGNPSLVKNQRGLDTY